MRLNKSSNKSLHRYFKVKGIYQICGQAYRINKGVSFMATSFADMMSKNRQAIYKHAESNTYKNSDGVVVIPKNDEWRKEKIWDKLLSDSDKSKL